MMTPRLSTRPITTVSGWVRPRAGGYTLLEVVVVLILVVVMAAVLAPRFIGSSGFTGETTANQLLVAARYAETLAQNQDVATDLKVAAGSFRVTQHGTPVPNPALQSATLVVTIPAGVTITPHTTVTFEPQQGINFAQQGLPNRAETFTIRGAGLAATVHVAATGYIYGCQASGPCP